MLEITRGFKMNEILILKEQLNNIRDGKDIFNKIKKIKIDYEKENVIIFYLNTSNQVIKTEILFMGGIDSCILCPNTIFRQALKHNAPKIIIAHNHPSGNLKPSYEDIEVFDKLKSAGDIINIKVLDSIIFNKKEFYTLIK